MYICHWAKPCMSSRIRYRGHPCKSDHQPYCDWLNEPFAVSPYESLC